MTRESDRTVGRIAVRLGLITEAQLEDAVQEQARLAAAGSAPLIGQILVQRGVLQESGLEQVLAEQKHVLAERERDGFSRIGAGDAFRMMGMLDDALKMYRSVLEDFADSLKVCASARKKVTEVEAELKS